MKKKVTSNIDAVKKAFVIHPILLAVFPVLFLYTQNIKEATARQVYWPLFLALAGTLALWIVLRIFMKSTAKAAFATSIFVVLFFVYGRFHDVLAHRGLGIKDAYLLPLFLLVWGYCVYFIKIAKTNFGSTTQILNVIGVVLVLINIFNITYYQLSKSDVSARSTAQSQNIPVTGNEGAYNGIRPDIYYIILDEYAHPDTMREYYNYDNTEFTDYLQSKGFYWASESRTRENESARSIGSALNMKFIPAEDSSTTVFQKIENNLVASQLKSYGYQFIFYGWWKINADYSYNYYATQGGSGITAEFYRTLWNTTMLSPFYDYLIVPKLNNYWMSGINGTLDALKRGPAMPGPKCIFVHLMCPHEPFVFSADGGNVLPSNWSNYEDKRYYLGQYIYITGQIEEVIDSILSNSATEPIIIVQSDHGIRPGHKNIQIGTDEWRKIMNAYYLPGDAGKLLYKNITPVNSFRVIFNYYFGADYELLKE